MTIRTKLEGFAVAICALVPQAGTAQVSVPPELQAKIATHPYTRQVMDWGSRPEWSADSKRLIFVSKEFGDVYELDIATGKTQPLTYGYPHEGILRAYYLRDGNYLLSAARDHVAGLEPYTRILEPELWLLDKSLTGAAMPLNVRMSEGVAVARSSMRIAWMASAPNLPPKPQPRFPGDRPTITTRQVVDLLRKEDNPDGGIWMGEVVVESSTAKVINQRKVVGCEPDGPLSKALARLNQKCSAAEPQNFVPHDENRLTFTALASDDARPFIIHTFVIDLTTGKLVKLNMDDLHAEVEGVFADGKSTLVEHSPDKDGWKGGMSVDLWQVPLDGSGRMSAVTQYNAIDPELKSNQGVVSPDGRWLAFSVGTRSMERVSAGQGIGIFLMDLKAAGF